MDVLGIVTVPRRADISRSAGAFFSAVVEAKTGPNAWAVRLDGRTVVVTTALELRPGQVLRLRLESQTPSTLQFRTETPVPAPPGNDALAAAFLSRGLPLAADRLSVWTRWLAKAPAASDREGWAASLEARGLPPQGAGDALLPWLRWQSDLEQGRASPPPEDEPWWDLWNSRKTSSGDAWLVLVLRWVFAERVDSGLLQAHWNPQAQAVDRWQLTASPGGTPFRLAAAASPGHLALTWHFFRQDDERAWSQRAAAWGAALTDKDLKVTLTIAGRPVPDSHIPAGVDVIV